MIQAIDKKAAAVIFGLAVLGVAAPYSGSFVLLLITKALVFSILVMSTDLLLGYTGLPPLGQSAFLTIGAYLAAILAKRYGIGLGCDALAVLALGALAGGALAAVFGLVAIRAGGVYFMMITLALGMIVWGVAHRWNSMTSGDNGINLPQRPVCGADFSNPVAYFYLALAMFVVVLCAYAVLVRSPFGRSLLGIRESELRMRILGYNTWLHKYVIFIISGAGGGLAGVLWVYFNRIVSPEDAVMRTSVDALLMVILGGPGTLVGSAIGAAAVIFLREYVSTLVTWWLYILGAVYILTIYYLPEGLMGIPAMVRNARARPSGGPAAGETAGKTVP
jgi:branched-chain amino acid transport system permease protein